MNEAYAYKNEKNILEKSSSGGAFLGIVKAFTENVATPWSVYGVKFDENFNVVHDRATSIEECYKFCGSKYVKSNLGDNLSKVEEDLKNDMFVLFTGTPCQISLLKKFLEKNSVSAEKLLLVDLVCHGTPNQDFWKDWVAYIEKRYNSKIKNFSFRYKPVRWKGYPVLIEFENGKKLIENFETTSYIRLFSKRLIINKGCFKCPYPSNFKSDLTISDFWGVQTCMPEIPIEGGVSLIVAHSEKGNSVISKMKPEPIKLLNDDYLKFNHNLTKQTQMPEKYDVFWDDYRSQGMEYILKKYANLCLKEKVKFNVKKFFRNSGVTAKIKKLLGKEKPI